MSSKKICFLLPLFQNTRDSGMQKYKIIKVENGVTYQHAVIPRLDFQTIILLVYTTYLTIKKICENLKKNQTGRVTDAINQVCRKPRVPK